jgi:hypothetical protein
VQHQAQVNTLDVERLLESLLAESVLCYRSSMSGSKASSYSKRYHCELRLQKQGDEDEQLIATLQSGLI